MIIYQIYML